MERTNAVGESISAYTTQLRVSVMYSVRGIEILRNIASWEEKIESLWRNRRRTFADTSVGEGLLAHLAQKMINMPKHIEGLQGRA
jgi:hypothetical protein